MSKIFTFNPKLNGSYIDSVSGTKGVNTNGQWKITEKGWSWLGNQSLGSNILFSNISNVAFGTNDFTIEVVFKKGKYNNIGSAWNGLFGTTGIGNTNGFGVGYLSDNKLAYIEGVTGANQIFSDNALIDDQWYHVVVKRLSGIGNMYINSIQQSDSTSLTANLISDDLYIGYDSTATRYSNSHISKIIMWNKALSTQEIQSLYEDFLRPKNFGVHQRRKEYPNKSEDLSNEDGLVAAYNMKLSPDGVVTDISHNDNNGINNGAVSTKNGMYFDGTAWVNLGSLTLPEANSVNIRIKVDSSDFQYTISLGITNGFGMFFASGILYVQKYLTTDAYSYSGMQTGTDYNISINNNNGVFSLYLNGINTPLIMSGNAPPTGGSHLGQRGNGTAYLIGDIQDTQIYGRLQTDQEIQEYHNQFVRPVLVEDFSDDSVGLSPRFWQKGTGTYTVQENTDGSKFNQCDVAGTIVIQSDTAYGKWEFDVYKGVGNSSFINFIAQDINPITSMNGYVLRNPANRIALTKYTNGVALDLFYTTISYIQDNIWYCFRIERTEDGEFTVYIRSDEDSNFSDWTLVDPTGGSGTNPVVDNTYTTSKYFVKDLDAGDRFTDLVIINGIEAKELDPNTLESELEFYL
jgi:hypothetical protein